jgi:hypothetical protein
MQQCKMPLRNRPQSSVMNAGSFRIVIITDPAWEIAEALFLK